MGVGLTTLIVTVLASGAAFVGFQRELSQRQVRYLADYVHERGTNIDKRFTDLAAVQQAAVQDLALRLDHLDQSSVNARLDQDYPLQPDGTRRSRPQAFDGERTAGGQWTYGLGAFLGRAAQMSVDDKAVFVEAYDLVDEFGRAARGAYDNFYFFTPTTRLVMFAPDRPDRLMFYRHDAPASLDISGESIAKLALPAADRSRIIRCTDLQTLIQAPRGRPFAVGCVTPAYWRGRYLGAFGSSLDLTSFIHEATQNALPGATSLVVGADGRLVASPEFANPGAVTPAIASDYQQRMSLRTLVAAIERTGQASGAIESPDRRLILAFRRLSGPDWYLLEVYPKAALRWSAALSAAWVLGIGLLAALFQTLAIVLLARRSVAQPLQALADGYASGNGRALDVEALAKVEARADEIGLLARALRQEHEMGEAALSSLEERVRARTADLERANSEKSRFLANMSHELRTPLNGVIAISETLAQRQRTKRDKELAALIISSGRLLEQVLSDILDFSKIEAGEITLADEVFELEAVVGRIAQLHRAAAEAKGLMLIWRVEPSAAGCYRGDSVRLTQVLSNLLSNAVKFTQFGSVILTAEADADGLRFSVVDSGIGFDDQVKARLFRRFEQADASIRRRFGGTGLGLAISRSLVELMGGEIDVTSVQGLGSTFEFVLPLARAEAEAVIAPPEAHDTISLDGRRVLLAEDHPTNQKVIQLILDVVGVELEIVENGALALDRLRAARFDIVLMDMQMPELDGLSATTALRALEQETGAGRTPVIMLTANAMDEHVRASLAAGADEHLSKPIRPQILIESICRHIQAADSAAAGPANASAA